VSRAALSAARRVVVKIGSRSLVGASVFEPAPDAAARFDSIARQCEAQRAAGRAVVLVSSGAVALGRGRLGVERRRRSIAELQACAAVGQSLLMRGWELAFGAHGTIVAQMLLSHAGLEDRERYLNARRALDALLEVGAVPVINENDCVAVGEIRFGDNYQLAAMVCTLADADLLVLLTDVEGLLDGGARVSRVEDVDAVRGFVAELSGAGVGSGGMGSKLEAARRASRRGVPVVIADARDDAILERVLGGEDAGTLVAASATRLPARKHWIAFTLRPRGDLVLDDGAVRAIRDGGKSLLPIGLVGVRGAFSPGDAVVLRYAGGAEVGRGLVRYGTADAATLAGARSDEIEGRLGFNGGDELVHRDDLVVSRG